MNTLRHPKLRDEADSSWQDQPMLIKLALPPAAAVLIEVETSSRSQFKA